MRQALEWIMLFFGGVIFVYMLIVIVAYSLMFLFALLELKKQRRLDRRELDERFVDAFYSKPVSILVPAYNEQAGVVASIHSLLNLDYPQTELLVIDDGSKDETAAVVIRQFDMEPAEKPVMPQLRTKPVKEVYRSRIHPNLWLIRKENGGKGDALNVGINYARYPYFCTIDGDSILDTRSLLRVMKPIMTSNGQVVAAGGNVRIVNGLSVEYGAVDDVRLSGRALVVMQVVEYLRAFLMGRIALSKFNMVLIISGAFSVFSKKFAIAAGGYNTTTIGEDMEMVVKIQRFLKEQKLNNRVEFVPDPVCWTEAPQSLSILRRQRRRWHQGLLESLWAHRRMTFNPKYGAVGMISFPYFWLVECFGPVIELGGYLYVILAFFLGGVYYEYAVLLMLLFILYGTVFSIGSVLLESWSLNAFPKRRDVLRMMALSLTEVAWYKPLTLFWRIEGLVRSMFRISSWGEMERIGATKGAPK
ncbi:glycosyltransferase family 2 protein [Edaphobacillus lindanitolerans]|uniref:Glycosyltransferase, catalytic subunit of cellulose synthase and poly-beta-1,6-N-acetylglucosamine synthase n=1 Tax=Edaphobacillus lindanitolerans TaxID=550447 RepID=A0A1U7PN63_9BACI|nr:glycosyltransferase [Edaphobacillus lindanitolerans]SIT72128.1 Glycosyltransferase, catalytic subunit of cellulose synthase and poly-beta-1,6-N-acetylglucosamine synthase [Edaphobacillus lindanitolerans]